MRYKAMCDSLQAFLAARDTVTREWALSKSTVMCLEVDLGGAVRMVAWPCATLPGDTSGAKLIRVSYFDEVGLPVPLGRLQPKELVSAKEIQVAINQWISGDREELPTSTSTRMADRLKRR